MFVWSVVDYGGLSNKFLSNNISRAYYKDLLIIMESKCGPKERELGKRRF